MQVEDVELLVGKPDGGNQGTSLDEHRVAEFGISRKRSFADDSKNPSSTNLGVDVSLVEVVASNAVARAKHREQK